MWKVLAGTVLVVLLCGTGARAQAAQVAWTAPIEAQSAAEAGGYLYTLYVNRLSTTPIVASLTAVVCTGVAPGPFNCTAPIPPLVPIVLGARWELTAKTATSPESGFSVPFTLSLSAPTALRRQ